MSEYVDDTGFLESIIKIEPEEFETIQEKAADENLESKHPKQFPNNDEPATIDPDGSHRESAESLSRKGNEGKRSTLPKSSSKFACENCDFKTARKGCLERHKLTHAAKTQCPICNKQVSSLKTHMQNHQPKVSCSICQKTILPRCMKKHMRIHRKQKCGDCEESFECNEELRRHKLRSHFKGKIHECHCGAVFTANKSLRFHQKSHKGEETTCDVCQNNFSSTRTLKRHREKQHGLSTEKVIVLNTSGPFICDKCGLKFKTRRSFYQHIRIHQNPKMFCDLCPRSFTKKSLVAYHIMRDHLELRPFQCNVCPYKASTRSDLKVHKLRHGSKKKCQICNKLVAYMIDHLRTHIKAKCPVCSKTYSRINLSKHMKIHTKDR